MNSKQDVLTAISVGDRVRDLDGCDGIVFDLGPSSDALVSEAPYAWYMDFSRQMRRADRRHLTVLAHAVYPTPEDIDALKMAEARMMSEYKWEHHHRVALRKMIAKAQGGGS